MSDDIILELKNVSKSFGGVHALKNVDLTVHRGKVNVLIGENGAGKSTLMKILSGAVIKDNGEIIYDGQKIEINSPSDSLKHNIAMIYQEFNLVQEMTVQDNIFLGKEITNKLLVDKKQTRKMVQKIMQEYDIDLDPGDMVENLSIAKQQILEIMKALSSNSRIIVMDEPTSSLSLHEVRRLFEIIYKLKEQGITIIFISHRLEEVFEIGDYVAALRDGCFIGEWPIGEVTDSDLIMAIVGREIDHLFPKKIVEIGDTLLKVENLTKSGVYENISFDVKKGEIMGMAGLIGAGRTEVALSIFGDMQFDSGTISIMGKQVKFKSPHEAMRNKVAYLTEDRKKYGVDLDAKIKDSISITNLERISKYGFIQKKREVEFCEDAVKMLNIKTPSILDEVNTLSGGNQQKVSLAKWITRNVDILILDEPTRGIDIGAKEEIHKLIGEIVKQGAAVILISSELPEVLGMSDRIVVMHEGKVKTILNANEATQEIVMQQMIG
ncbi:MAG: sugar ABC transporter ATP-binding protein [Oscillospiraceae bacterium]|nr:sugar ABC transporter ATP-binding protein [Oscillospiraceae bacterium]